LEVQEKLSQRRLKDHKQLSYKKYLRQTFSQHKHLFMSACILVILALPRLIISLLFRCMESARNPWLFLIGYFVSFIPSALVFAVFVLSSTSYKKIFKQQIKRIRRKFCSI
jgi:hypothetical protein